MSRLGYRVMNTHRFRHLVATGVDRAETGGYRAKIKNRNLKLDC
jgi:hypothetical protein